jgi:hypothetical protein
MLFSKIKKELIWIGTNDRLTAYHPKAIKRDTIPPNMTMTGVALFNENIPWTDLEHKKDTNFVLGNRSNCWHFKFDELIETGIYSGTLKFTLQQ